MKLRHEVLKIDVGAALQVLNFAIFHKELTDMEDREQRETEKQQDAGAGGDNVDGPGGASGGNDVHGSYWTYGAFWKDMVFCALGNHVPLQTLTWMRANIVRYLEDWDWRCCLYSQAGLSYPLTV
ncbi:uncharacterized protein LOC123401083 [Hordeum vulgare subsp. vulgare]|uniref:uncharacterized protein LOC123401083 n=1 Tax=Hordeum vulgare subsp. vulgare TaxID=112509 RepID=UPI001D1A56A2|nr:uncharacterized protein LOC123401083 [Hordeum vulgare subsp. vulgare]XP_044950736.1 uncharacterized protein LOC123401083 [Hordeum vulgare subsp. vulgare]